ncbi:MAG: magnesium transporter CorA family protein [Patescibacteria group bacterium]|nr:magnesium transporter CorA family protein [Patescibacteria group bacterium]
MAVQSLRAFTHTETDKMTWVMVGKNDQKTLKALKGRFNFHDIDLEDAAPPIQSPKLAVRDGYIFMILQFPIFNRQNRIISTAEVDFFIMDNLLVTVDTSKLIPLQELYENFRRTKGGVVKDNITADDVPHLIYLILDTMLSSVFPMIRHISNDVDSIESQVFTNLGKDLIRELLRVKTNIVNIRKSMQGHKTVIRKLIEVSQERFPGIRRFEEYFDKLVDSTKDIWDNLQLQKETIEALHETNTSLADFKMNEIIKILTIFSCIIFPLTLIATLFSMRAAGMPLVDSAYGFWGILGLMAACTVLMVAFFRHKKWL